MVAGPSQDVVRRAFDAFERRDVDAFVALCHREVEFSPITREILGRAEPYRGHAGMREYMDDVAATWEELRPAPSEYRCEGEWVVALGRVYARRGGRVLDSPAGWAFRVVDGLIVEGRIFASRAEALAYPTAARSCEGGAAGV